MAGSWEPLVFRVRRDGGIAAPAQAEGGSISRDELVRREVLGVLIAVGMLVDNAVVVLENIFRHVQAGQNAFAAAVDGTKEVAGAVIASTLTTLAAESRLLVIQA